MKRYLLTPAAEEDLFSIWAYIAIDNPLKADEVENDLFSACERVAAKPDLGHFRRDLTDKPVRFFTVRANYLVVYDPASEPLQILRFLHGARDVAAELE
jgi:antitoxin ParD1/3/4